jgi:hypothetical protein
MNVGELDERVPRLLDDDRTEQTEKGIAVDLAAWGVGKLLGDELRHHPFTKSKDGIRHQLLMK